MSTDEDIDIVYDDIIDALKRTDTPITRNNFILFNWEGEAYPEEWTAEYESQLPRELQDWSLFKALGGKLIYIGGPPGPLDGDEEEPLADFDALADFSDSDFGDKFNPRQTRAPSGTDIGGQWIKGSGVSGVHYSSLPAGLKTGARAKAQAKRELEAKAMEEWHRRVDKAFKNYLGEVTVKVASPAGEGDDQPGWRRVALSKGWVPVSPDTEVIRWAPTRQGDFVRNRRVRFLVQHDREPNQEEQEQIELWAQADVWEEERLASLASPREKEAESLKNTALKARLRGIAQDVADAQRFAGKLEISDTTYDFELGGKQLTAAGTYDSSTDTITLYADDQWNHMTDDGIAGTMMHEIMHHRWSTVEKMLMMESYELSSVVSKKGFSAVRTASSGALKPPYNKQFPVSGKLAFPIMESVKYREKLRDSDGFTDYSTKWWQEADEQGEDLAINETLAEIHKLHYLRPSYLESLDKYKNGGWKRLYETVNKLYEDRMKLYQESQKAKGIAV